MPGSINQAKEVFLVSKYPTNEVLAVFNTPTNAINYAEKQDTRYAIKRRFIHAVTEPNQTGWLQ